MVRAWREAEQGQDLGDGDGGAHRGEVDGGARRVRRRFHFLVSSLAHLLATFPSFGELAIACGMDGFVAAEEFGFWPAVSDLALPGHVVVLSDALGYAS